MSTTFIAAYEDDCDECGMLIEEGDEIGYGPFRDILCEDCHTLAWAHDEWVDIDEPVDAVATPS